MSISNLFVDNNYELKIKGLTVLNLDTVSLNTDDFTVNGSQPKGTILASDGTSMKNQALGLDGYILKARPAQPNGVAWEAPSAGDGNIYDNDGTLAGPRELDANGNTLMFKNIEQTDGFVIQSALTEPSSLTLLSDGGAKNSHYTVFPNGSTIISDCDGTDMINNVQSLQQTTVNGTQKLVLRSAGTADLDCTNLTRNNSAPAGALLKGTGTSYNTFTRGSAGQVLKVNGGGTDLEWATDSAGINIYDSDGTLTGNRVVSCATNNISFNNTPQYTISGTGVGTSVFRQTDGVLPLRYNNISQSGNATSTDVVYSVNNSNYLRVNYSAVSGLTEEVVLESENNNVAVSAANDINISANNKLDLSYTTLKFNNNSVAGGLLKANGTTFAPFERGTAGQVLKVNAGGTDLEWATDSAGINIYDSNGSIPAATTRVVSDSGGSQLHFSLYTQVNSNLAICDNIGPIGLEIGNTTPGGDRYIQQYNTVSKNYRQFHSPSNTTIFNVDTVSTTPAVSLSGTSINLNAATLTKQGVAPLGSLLVGSGSSYNALSVGSAGQVLTVSGGTAAWTAPANLYNTDGTISANRTVSLGANDLFFDITAGGAVAVRSSDSAGFTLQKTGTNASVSQIINGGLGLTIFHRGLQILDDSWTPTHDAIRLGDISGSDSARVELYSTKFVDVIAKGLRIRNSAPVGSLLIGQVNTGDNVYDSLPIGANGTVLTSNGTTATWASPSLGTPSYAEMFCTGNTALTAIASAGVAVKVNMTGFTTVGEKTSDWTITTTGDGNRMTYTGTTTKLFRICSSVSGYTDGGTKTVYGLIYKDGVALTKTESWSKWEAITKDANFNPTCIVSMSTNNYLELFISNNDDATDLTVSEANINVAAVDYVAPLMAFNEPSIDTTALEIKMNEQDETIKGLVRKIGALERKLRTR